MSSDPSRSRTRHHDAWRPLIDAAKRGDELTAEQLRALRLRHFTLQTLQLFTPLRLEQLRQQDITLEQALSAFRLGQTALRDMSPNPTSVRGRKLRGDAMLLKTAEMIGQRWAQLDIDAMAPFDEVLTEVEQHITEADQHTFILDSRPVSEAARRWIVQAAAANLDGPILLASDLGAPILPA